MRSRLLAAALLAPGCSAPALTNFTLGHDSDPEGSTSESSGTSSSGTSSGSDSSGGQSGTSTTGTISSSSSTSGHVDPDTMSTDTSSTSTGTSTGEAVCGDGIAQGEEECDDANDDDLDRCANNCTRNRWVFATAATDHSGDMGGLDAVDGRCKQYALQSGKADDTWKTFIAWISDADHDVRDRLYPGKGRYMRTDGEIVVETVDEFFSGTLQAPINVDEYNNPAPGGAITGTMPDGTAAPGTHCENWTSGSILDVSKYTGSTSATDIWWTMGQNPDTNPKDCAGLGARLYCIEGA